jgi:hypothetical protein
MISKSTHFRVLFIFSELVYPLKNLNIINIQYFIELMQL